MPGNNTVPWGLIVPGRVPTPSEGHAQSYKRWGPPEQQRLRSFDNGTCLEFGPDDDVLEYDPTIHPFGEQIAMIDMAIRDCKAARAPVEVSGHTGGRARTLSVDGMLSFNVDPFDHFREHHFDPKLLPKATHAGGIYTQTASRFATVGNSVSVYSVVNKSDWIGEAHPGDRDSRFGVGGKLMYDDDGYPPRAASSGGHSGRGDFAGARGGFHGPRFHHSEEFHPGNRGNFRGGRGGHRGGNRGGGRFGGRSQVATPDSLEYDHNHAPQEFHHRARMPPAKTRLASAAAFDKLEREQAYAQGYYGGEGDMRGHFGYPGRGGFHQGFQGRGRGFHQGFGGQGGHSRPLAYTGEKFLDVEGYGQHGGEVGGYHAPTPRRFHQAEGVENLYRNADGMMSSIPNQGPFFNQRGLANTPATTASMSSFQAFEEAARQHSIATAPAVQKPSATPNGAYVPSNGLRMDEFGVNLDTDGLYGVQLPPSKPSLTPDSALYNQTMMGQVGGGSSRKPIPATNVHDVVAPMQRTESQLSILARSQSRDIFPSTNIQFGFASAAASRASSVSRPLAVRTDTMASTAARESPLSANIQFGFAFSRASSAARQLPLRSDTFTSAGSRGSSTGRSSGSPPKIVLNPEGKPTLTRSMSLQPPTEPKAMRGYNVNAEPAATAPGSQLPSRSASTHGSGINLAAVPLSLQRSAHSMNSVPTLNTLHLPTLHERMAKLQIQEDITEDEESEDYSDEGVELRARPRGRTISRPTNMFGSISIEVKSPSPLKGKASKEAQAAAPALPISRSVSPSHRWFE